MAIAMWNRLIALQLGGPTLKTNHQEQLMKLTFKSHFTAILLTSSKI